jgi:3-oxoacyl-ACP reductase-like protein
MVATADLAGPPPKRTTGRLRSPVPRYDYFMGATRRCLIGAFVAVVAAAAGVSGAPSAAGAPSNCQQVGATIVCGQGGLSDIPGHNGVMAPFGAGCINAYGTYQNCAVQRD